MNVLVFDIGGTSIKYGLCDDEGLLWHKEVPTNAKKGGRFVIDTVISLISGTGESFDAIGISTAGQVNSREGYMIYANENIPGYTGMRIREELEALFHVPVMVENDVNSAAMGEAVCGAGKDHDDFLCLTYGTGVGGAIVINKEIFHGSSSSAAEFGAIVTHGQERIGKDDFFAGCYERYASTTALVKKAMEFDESLTDGRKIFARIQEPQVMNILDNWVDEVMLGLATLTHIFNPSCIILGGGIMAQPMIAEMVERKKSIYFMPSFAHVKITQAELGNTAGLLGINHLARTYAKSK